MIVFVFNRVSVERFKSRVVSRYSEICTRVSSCRIQAIGLLFN